LGGGGREGRGGLSTCHLIAIALPGSYATYLDEVSPGQAPVAESYKPDNLRQWLSFSANSGHTFDFDYMLLWGGQYLPAIQQGQGWRWVTAGRLHLRGRASQVTLSILPCRTSPRLPSLADAYHSCLKIKGSHLLLAFLLSLHQNFNGIKSITNRILHPAIRMVSPN
jgi:hypothetical protein